MKKIILSAVMLFMAMGLFAQEQVRQVRTPSGYQGFLEYGNNWTVFDQNLSNTIGLTTTHGFYFNGHIYTGVGIGFDACRGFMAVPIYANLRYVILNKTVASPFLSLRLGSYISKQVGAYGDFAMGVRFASKRDFAVSIMAAISYYDKITYTDWEDYQDELGHWHSGNIEKTIYPSSVSLRIGIEW